MKNFLDWSSYKDAGMGDPYADIPKNGKNWAKAIAACINSGQCEETGKQLMCPSYKITKNPHLSPGGRVKLLKQALSEEPCDLSDPELAAAMDLCVSCKGCKRECEANIDMALIKTEYLAQKNTKHKLSLRSIVFAYIPSLLHHIPGIRALILLRNNNKLLAWLSEKLLGISAKAKLPAPHKHPIKNIKVNTPNPPPNADSQKQVILFIDTFARHFEPEIAHSAIAVLQRMGYTVQEATPSDKISRPLCCGRTYLAQGMVEQARFEASRLIDALIPYAKLGIPIIGLEASCVLGLRDDALALGLGKKAEVVAKHILMFEEFIAREFKSNPATIDFLPPTQKTLVHGHCHQKSAGAMKSMRRVLKAVPEHQFEMIDSSCCGMAGTFGLEKEHFQIGLEMAEANLFPVIRNNADANFISNGFSCRHQIKSHTRGKPMHLAVFLNGLIATSE